MAAISSLQIGGVTYDIYAKSAEQAPGSSHELSSHSHFSTYFNVTSANSALTSKSALSAGSAAKAASATSALSAGTAKSASQVFGILATATSTAVTGTKDTIGSVVNPKLVFSNSGQNQKGFIIWSDYNAANAWSGDASAYFGGVAISDGFVLTSDQGNSITLAKNLSATNFKATKISATNITATTFSGTLSGNASSAKNAGTATYATSAGAAPVASHNHNYTISAKTTAFNVSAGIQLSAGSNINITSAGANAIGISARNDIANASDKSTYFDGTSALYAKSATSATNAAKAADSDKLGGVLPGGYSLSGHNHAYKLSGNGTAVNVSAGVNFKPSGSNIKFYVSGNDIYISAKNDNSTAYIPSGFQVSAINGTTTGVYYLSALKLNAGTNIGFTSASNSQITITAKDTTYTTSNFITANKTVGVSSNGTNVGTVNLSAISFSAGSNIALGTAANNIITITAKDTTYTSLNSINATEYNALTSTSANSRNPNAHQLSSHTNFSTYFNGTSANTALTSKTALSAGIATKTQITDHTANDTDYAPIWTNRTNSSLYTTSSKYKFNPAAGRLYVSNIVKVGGCSMTWNASTSALDFNF